MQFSNSEIPVEVLPQMEEISFQPLEKNYLKTLRISYIISTLVVLAILVAAFVFIKKIQLTVVIVPVAIAFITITLLGWLTTVVGFKVSGYSLREKDVLYRSGWLVRKTRIVPLNRIQHVSVQSGPIERKFQLASVSLFTAGAGQADFTIPGITEPVAHQIKDWLTAQLNGRTHQN